MTMNGMTPTELQALSEYVARLYDPVELIALVDLCPATATADAGRYPLPAGFALAECRLEGPVFLHHPDARRLLIVASERSSACVLTWKGEPRCEIDLRVDGNDHRARLAIEAQALVWALELACAHDDTAPNRMADDDASLFEVRKARLRRRAELALLEAWA
jgi:hypothetical protein